MRAYATIRFIDEDWGDPQDFQRHARKSCIGRVRTEDGVYKNYIRNASTRRRIRRALKRGDRARVVRYERSIS